MLIRVIQNLYYGDISICSTNRPTLHACKDPCHRKAIGYSGHLSKNHPNYLFYQSNENLYVNIIDSNEPLFFIDLFTKSIEFIERHIENSSVYVHCCHGLSRSPSIVLVYMAKHKLIDNSSYEVASRVFSANYKYSPNSGIKIFLSKNWDKIISWQSN